MHISPASQQPWSNAWSMYGDFDGVFIEIRMSVSDAIPTQCRKVFFEWLRWGDSSYPCLYFQGLCQIRTCVTITIFVNRWPLHYTWRMWYDAISRLISYLYVYIFRLDVWLRRVHPTRFRILRRSWWTIYAQSISSPVSKNMPRPFSRQFRW